MRVLWIGVGCTDVVMATGTSASDVRIEEIAKRTKPAGSAAFSMICPAVIARRFTIR